MADALSATAGEEPAALVQDVLETTLQHIAELPDDTNLVAWMTRVMRNRFIDRCRRLKVRGTQTPIEDVPVAAPVKDDEAWWQRLGADDIRARLAELPADQRRAFELFAFEDAPVAYDRFRNNDLKSRAVVTPNG